MGPRVFILLGLFALSCVFWQYSLLLAARYQFPTKQLISTTCSGAEHAADREFTRLEDAQRVDILVVGTADFVDDVQRILPRDSNAVVANVVVEVPSPAQFASATTVFDVKRPRIRIFQNAPHIWTNFSKDYIDLKQSTVLTKVTNRAKGNVKVFKTALDHLELTASSAHVLFAQCDALQSSLPKTLLWSSFLPKDMLQERIEEFVHKDKIGQKRGIPTYWIYDFDWIPKTVLPEVKTALFEFYTAPKTILKIGEFVDLAGMERILKTSD